MLQQQQQQQQQIELIAEHQNPMLSLTIGRVISTLLSSRAKTLHQSIARFSLDSSSNSSSSLATVDESLRFLINYIRDSLRLKESKRYKQVIILLDWLFRDDETPVSPVEENTETPPDVTEESSEAPTADSNDNSTPGASALWKKLWAEQGDEVSLEYAGTHALKGDLVRFGKQTIGGMIKDGMSALARYYLDNFHDGDALDLISGRYFVNSNSLSPFQLNGFDVAITIDFIKRDLGSQGLRGYISEQISLLTDLVTLNLSSNSLEGRLPSGLGHKSLATLDLSNNQFTGSIPDSLTTSSLKLMILNGNLLEGRVPEQLYSIGVHGGEIEYVTIYFTL
ncbi:hypothetical protein ACFE04_029284 [Oxalis oulophora]